MPRRLDAKRSFGNTEFTEDTEPHALSLNSLLSTLSFLRALCALCVSTPPRQPSQPRVEATPAPKLTLSLKHRVHRGHGVMPPLLSALLFSFEEVVRAYERLRRDSVRYGYRAGHRDRIGPDSRLGQYDREEWRGRRGGLRESGPCMLGRSGGVFRLLRGASHDERRVVRVGGRGESLGGGARQRRKDGFRRAGAMLAKASRRRRPAGRRQRRGGA